MNTDRKQTRTCGDCKYWISKPGSEIGSCGSCDSTYVATLKSNDFALNCSHFDSFPAIPANTKATLDEPRKSWYTVMRTPSCRPEEHVYRIFHTKSGNYLGEVVRGGYFGPDDGDTVFIISDNWGVAGIDVLADLVQAMNDIRDGKYDHAPEIIGGLEVLLQGEHCNNPYVDVTLPEEYAEVLHRYLRIKRPSL